MNRKIPFINTVDLNNYNNDYDSKWYCELFELKQIPDNILCHALETPYLNHLKLIFKKLIYRKLLQKNGPNKHPL